MFRPVAMTPWLARITRLAEPICCASSAARQGASISPSYFSTRYMSSRKSEPRLMNQFRKCAQGSDQADVVGMVVDHHPSVGPDPVEFGVDVDGGRDVPA